MALSVGDIYFTALITDQDTTSGTGQESFSFVVTTNVSAGETITFHQPEAGGDDFFTYTVGAGGLSAGDRVTIRENPGATPMEILHDPSGGSVSAITGSLSITATDEFIASQGGQVLAAISNGGNWDQGHLALAGLSRSALDTWVTNNPGLASPAVENLDGGSGVDDNLMFIGGNILLHGDDPAYWTGTIDIVDHTNPNINGTTYATQDSAIFLCFAAGTLIATAAGEVPVEDLRIGDSVTTAEGRAVSVKWIGRQTVHTRFGPAER
ncbi:Hint domain-containing protein, partial [Nioella ostreopsis]|uniref:Hint domain-containing protein n=1 Tax=Nioella ostreopsis TaxID=2448479 RepID=UPI001F0C40D1